MLYRNMSKLRLSIANWSQNSPAATDYLQGLATCCNNTGLVLNHLGRRAEALAKLRDGLAINKKLTDQFPAAAEYRLSLAGNYQQYGHRQRMHWETRQRLWKVIS